MKYAELKRFLKSKGCYNTRTGTDHEKWKSPYSKLPFTVSRHDQQEVPPGTLKAILRQAGLDK